MGSWTVVVGAIAILLAIGLSFRAPDRLRDRLFGPPMSDDARRIIAILLVGGFALWLGIGSWLVRIEAELRELRCLILEEASCETPAAETGEGVQRRTTPTPSTLAVAVREPTWMYNTRPSASATSTTSYARAGRGSPRLVSRRRAQPRPTNWASGRGRQPTGRCLCANPSHRRAAQPNRMTRSGSARHTPEPHLRESKRPNSGSAKAWARRLHAR